MEFCVGLHKAINLWRNLALLRFELVSQTSQYLFIQRNLAFNEIKSIYHARTWQGNVSTRKPDWSTKMSDPQSLMSTWLKDRSMLASLETFRGPFLTSLLGAGKLWPQGRSCPPGVNFVPWGVNFSAHPSILLNSRECSPLGVNEGVNTPSRRQISPLGAKFTPGSQGWS
jgi:hypothetical protein